MNTQIILRVLLAVPGWLLYNLAMLPLVLLGLVICALPVRFWPGLWQNKEDGPNGIYPATWWGRYRWSALRNSVGNARWTRLFGMTVDPAKTEIVVRDSARKVMSFYDYIKQGPYLAWQGWRYELKFSWPNGRIFWIGWRIAQQTKVTQGVGFALQPYATL